VARANEGQAAWALTASARAEAAACLLQLEPYGATLGEATAYYLDHVLKYRMAPVVHDLVTGLVDEKEEQGLRPATVRSLRGFCRLLDERFGRRQLHEVTVDELKDLCHRAGSAPRTVWNRIHLARQVRNHAIGRGWAGENPACKLVASAREDREPGYLSVADVQRLLQVAGEYELLGYVALGLFAGVRSAELVRLDWSCVHREDREIVIDARAAKTRSRRVIPYDETLAAWLDLCPQRHGPIVNHRNLSRDLRRLRQAAGTAHWPHNALRHSFATYHLADHQDPVRTAYLLGHHFGSEMLTRHYRGLVSRTAAAEFWALRPATLTVEVPALRLVAQ
jgi:integrase